MRKNTKSRMFAFVGFKTEEEAILAKKYFHNTFIDTSRINIEYARPQNDPALPRPWSKHTKGSSQYQMLHGKPTREGNVDREEVNQEEIERKKQKFKDFLKVMGVSKDNKQSWNDSFSAFMADDGSSILQTNKKADKKDKKKKAEQDDKKEDEPKVEEAAPEKDIDEQRLYVMNLPFQITHDELRDTFEKFGEIEDIEVPLRKGGTGFGFAFIRFNSVEGAVSAFAEMDKKYYQGRKLHILPAQKKPPKPLVEEPVRDFDENMHGEGFHDSELHPDDAEKLENGHSRDERTQKKREEEPRTIDRPKKSNFKEEREQIQKTNFDDEMNWNYLFMNQDSVANAMAKKMNISKGSLLDKNQGNLAVRMAKAETVIINQTKEWMIENGIRIDELEKTDR